MNSANVTLKTITALVCIADEHLLACSPVALGAVLLGLLKTFANHTICLVRVVCLGIGLTPALSLRGHQIDSDT